MHSKWCVVYTCYLPIVLHHCSFLFRYTGSPCPLHPALARCFFYVIPPSPSYLNLALRALNASVSPGNHAALATAMRHILHKSCTWGPIGMKAGSLHLSHLMGHQSQALRR
ncbi:hypothetical protein B0H14DRAFT_3896367 [Mycena olivaceomarginata]|nr:hypothetical protein B0H14DRAFT_3896367 [Mycena olivaceomarginata]